MYYSVGDSLSQRATQRAGKEAQHFARSGREMEQRAGVGWKTWLLVAGAIGVGVWIATRPVSVRMVEP